MLPKIATPAGPCMQFLFTHKGRGLEPDHTPEDAGMEDGDEILAVEMMDLTGPEVVRCITVVRGCCLKYDYRTRCQNKRSCDYKRTGRWIL